MIGGLYSKKPERSPQQIFQRLIILPTEVISEALVEDDEARKLVVPSDRRFVEVAFHAEAEQAHEALQDWEARFKGPHELQRQAVESRYYNSHRCDAAFQISDRVWCKTHVLLSPVEKRCAKFADKYEGSY